MSAATLSITLILISAVTHALVGAIMKRSDDKLVLRGSLAQRRFWVLANCSGYNSCLWLSPDAHELT